MNLKIQFNCSYDHNWLFLTAEVFKLQLLAEPAISIYLFWSRLI